jgi:hypothetical protein
VNIFSEVRELRRGKSRTAGSGEFLAEEERKWSEAAKVAKIAN